ncbi:MAG: Eco57I restriction-modification methylase domain-containing protein [Melioribacteraceae bacterium]|nr:Eco57I restriction-modification methylase domain-containing protein [Melioribacteraceae bacterium]MCF8396272.1 Eco57I restriction-modification methylase domain-containing protein [Melioribacteraceae bacterium]MCF8421243.1 Eco57I restriction-modification methylase domain-containing protein [Melioribacteraceae bacterium]
MKIKTLTPKQTLNKAYRKATVFREEFETFRKNLTLLLNNIDSEEREENHKIHLKNFLDDTYYKGKHLINSKNSTDLVIYLENKQSSNAGVLLEIKRRTNKHEMINLDDINKKAFHELVLYYLQERIERKNDEIKYLIAANIYEWFIFDAVTFENLFYKNKKLTGDYTKWKNDQKVSGSTDHFYNVIVKPFIETLDAEIPFTYFNLDSYKKILSKTGGEIEEKLIPLYKIISPVHLLKQPFANDSNSLDRNFYNELLHIIGLEEVKEKNKKVINRKEITGRDDGSFIENAIQILKVDGALDRIKEPEKFGSTEEEQLYHIALELSLTWINRILFLKLLESQLYNYHKNDVYKFLNIKTITDFDELYKLFHSVLAVRINDRVDKIKTKYAEVPYLNSSLFEITELENQAIRINQLDDSLSLKIYKSSKLDKNKNDRPGTLQYLFEFLDAYNFTSEGKEKIEEEKKSLINASVLGLIFEKINGYKDGSYFTPGFITMYMCRETIRRAVVQKFNDKYEWKCETFDDLKNHLSGKRNTKDILEANEVVNSLKICDPAVGSGHFLVSALNEIITIKSELGILADDKGVILSGYEVRIENDELIITYNYGEEIFEYHPPKNSKDKANETQRVQEILFTQKQTIIENCLFGVDINPNSVKIAQLRLWIELLKNAYYTKESGYTELETLPNIDINIKEGNSLVSKFNIQQDIFPYGSRKILDVYKINVGLYKNEHNRDKRKELKKSIESTKERIRGFAVDPLKKENEKIEKLTEELHKLNTSGLFDKELTGEEKEKTDKKRDEISVKLNKAIEQRNSKVEEYKTLYSNAFEWRFEFPEVLDEEGNFAGFDVVIGNPPYYSLSKNKDITKYLEEAKFKTYSKSADIYCIFYERGFHILRKNGLLTYITSNSWIRAIYGNPLKQFFEKYMQPISLLNIEDIQIFEEATVESNIIILQKSETINSFLVANLSNDYSFGSSIAAYFSDKSFDFTLPATTDWVIGDEGETKLKQKIERNNEHLGELDVRINFGIKTGYNAAFIIDEETKDKLISEDKKSAEIIKPILRGRDLKKYSYEFSNFYLINAHNGLKAKSIEPINAEQDYPAIYKYLETFKPNIVTRQDQGDHWSNLRNCAYLEDFEKPKIIWGEISDDPKFAYDDQKYFAEATTFLMTGENLKYLLAILNSKVSEWYFKQIGTTTGMGTNRWKKYKIELLPIKKASKTEEKKIEKLVDKIITQKKKGAKADTTELESDIDQMVYKLYGLTEEEVKVVDPAFALSEKDNNEFKIE